jgi:hypothetical protein
MPEQKRQRLDDVPEFQRLSEHDKTMILRRMMTVYAAHRHPHRSTEMAKVIDRIIAELKAGQRGY